MTQIRKVLVANRGEIAVRIMRACREMGIGSAAVYSEADAQAVHVMEADEARCVGSASSSDSYLNIASIIAAARAVGADAVHPGYGFLAENASFARAVCDAGLVFVGPPADVIAAMGDKTKARQIAHAAGVPVVPADEAPPRDGAALATHARQLGYPLLIKAAAGGGGKGMRIVRDETELSAAFGSAGREAHGAFGDDRLFLERYIERPRHVEVQVLGDQGGTVLHVGERECSIQRRHQKVIEETPSPAVDTALRRRLTDAAVAVARSVGYQNAGTVEFLLAPNGEFYFLEMNTRLQVEHPITELVYGIDLVQAQLRIAMGERLWLRQDDIHRRGHAIECRICAEDASQQFFPSPGTILHLREPQGPGVRVDSGIATGSIISMHYDPLLAKLSVWGETREATRRRTIVALQNYVILGCTTAIPFLLDVLDHPAFVRGDTHTHFLQDHFPAWSGRDHHKVIAAIAAAIDLTRAQSTTSSKADQTAPSPWSSLGGWRLGRSPSVRTPSER